MRLIDADALYRNAPDAYADCFEDCRRCTKLDNGDLYELIEKQPTVDAVERKRGKWIKNEGKFGWHCSVCKVDNFYAYVWNSETGKNDFQDRYCPNCGAEMGGENNG